jgi:hypothetical protein
MKSPFPGMDPYIEACGLWEGFHSHLIEAIYQSIARCLPKGYTVDTAVRSYVVLMETFKETFVEIYAELPESTLVTCIEVLSPANKRRGTEGWGQYERKRQALLLGRANFIEIDLLRGGEKFSMVTPWPNSPYTLLVSRAESAPDCRVWLGHFHRPLPVIPVPLLPPDRDLSLDLQPLLDGIYSLGRYEERIDYTRTLSPLLSDTEAAAVRDFLKEVA